MRFDKILILGSGKIACDCARYLAVKLNIRDRIIVLETQENALSMLQRICNKENLEYSVITDKVQIENFLLKETEKKRVLIISANNRYIFTPLIIDKKDVEIINFHYALLPRYRGMNIPTWVIFNGERETGVTWHYVTEQVDCGKIIDQRIIPINGSTTAFDITRQGMLLANDSFKSFIKTLLEEKIEGHNVYYPKDDKIYYNSVLPMNGVLDLNQPIDLIIRLLRSFDYGKIEVIPHLKVVYLNNQYTIIDYKINGNEVSDSRMIIAEGSLLTIYDKKIEVQLKLKKS